MRTSHRELLWLSLTTPFTKGSYPLAASMETVASQFASLAGHHASIETVRAIFLFDYHDDWPTRSIYQLPELIDPYDNDTFRA